MEVSTATSSKSKGLSTYSFILPESILLVTSFANVDFPDDFGPHIRVTTGRCGSGTDTLANNSFHVTGEIMGCM